MKKVNSVLIALLLLIGIVACVYIITDVRQIKQRKSELIERNEKLQRDIDSLLVEVGRSEVRVDTLWKTVSGASVYVVQWQRNGVLQTDFLVSDNNITLGNGEPAGVLIEARVAARNSHGQTNPFTVLTGGTTIWSGGGGVV